MGPPSSVSAAVLGLAAWSSLLVDLVEANLRCYSCAPCNEFEFFAGDVHHFEVGLRSVGWDVFLKFSRYENLASFQADCYLDRYCMKISGATTGSIHI